MPIHPCADGLTKACFKAYPTWARQAFAYKLLHILLPKQLTKNLPRILSAALIAPGVELPPGVILPPGSVVFPDVSFPPGWTPGDLPPEGVIIPPDVSPVPPDTGAVSPLYVEPFEPGPIGGSQPAAVPPFDIGSLLVDQGATQQSRNLGNVDYWSDIAMAIKTWMSAEIRAIDIKIGNNNTPTDNIHLEIWQAGTAYLPIGIAGGGTSTTKNATSLPAFSLGQDYIRFLFPQKPILYIANRYDIIIARSGIFDAVNYYKIGNNIYPTETYYYKLPAGTWYSQGSGIINCRIWGFAL